MKHAHIYLTIAVALILAGCLTSGGDKSEMETKSWKLDMTDTLNFRGGGTLGYISSQSSRGYQISWVPGGGLAAYWGWPEDGLLRNEEEVSGFISDDFLERCEVIASGSYEVICRNESAEVTDIFHGDFRVDTMGVEPRIRLDSTWSIHLWIGMFPSPEDTLWRCDRQSFGLPEIHATLTCKAR
jgi:hypothetical protein